ncbi:MAG: hypothetical protein ACI36Y_08045 [Coriobacteriales bacterium]
MTENTNTASATTVYAIDLSMAGTIRIVGADAPRFVRTMYSGSMEAFDQLFGLSQGMILNSEGEVIDMVGVVRTGNDECLVITSTDNVGEVLMWLQAHAELEDDKGRIFPQVAVEDQSMKLAMMMLYGPGSTALFEELKAACEESRIFMIPCNLAPGAYAVPSGPGHFFVVAPNMAPQVGRFLNEHLNVEVLKLDEYTQQLMEAGRIAPALGDPGYHSPAELGLEPYLRDVRDFVGARALGLE